MYRARMDSYQLESGYEVDNQLLSIDNMEALQIRYGVSMKIVKYFRAIKH